MVKLEPLDLVEKTVNWVTAARMEQMVRKENLV